MLPIEFKDRIAAIIGADEAMRLIESIEKSDSVKAFRVNGIKTNIATFEQGDQIDRRRVDFPPHAYLTNEEFPGTLACHHSGAIYMQDISAMSTVHALDVPKGARVLDTCSAPGGKTTQMAEAVGDGGIVVANEYDAKRCRILQGNVERMGCKSTVVVNLDTSVLAECYPGTFDVVLCDAPCSGEGMFRKNPRAVEEWSVDNVLMCAERQREILSNVVQCVAPGGHLIYSTCTFSLEENEQNVEWLLDKYCDFSLVDVLPDLHKNTAAGITFEGCKYDMSKCRRIYPHLSNGEGQFVALFKRAEPCEVAASVDGKRRNKDKAASKRPDKKDLDAISLARELIGSCIDGDTVGTLTLIGDKVYLKPDIALPPHSVFLAGVCVGTVQNGRIEPHHQLFSAYGKAFCRRIELDSRDPDAQAYLRGEEISAHGVDNGYCAILIDGCAVGGGKISSDRCKNHYPKGLRIKKEF